MRLKYYLRGIGAGLVLATFLLMLSSLFNGNKESVQASDATSQEENVQEESPQENNKEEQSEEGKTQKDTSEDLETEEDVNTADVSDENLTDTDENKPIEEYVEEGVSETGDKEETVTYVSFTVAAGQSSEVISSNLYKNGLINNADLFNKYLNQLGVDDRIQSGTFYVMEGSSYDDIIALLVNKDVRTTTPPDSGN